MVVKKNRVLGWYLSIFNFIASKRKLKSEIDEREIHSFLISILVTGPILFLYALNFTYHLENRIPAIMGMVATLIHFTSPLLYLLGFSSLLASNIVLSTAMIFLSTFLFFGGGINNPAVIWFGIFPLFIGTICGRKTVIIWAIISLIMILSFMLLPFIGIAVEDLVSPKGKEFNQLILIFGVLLVNTSMIIVYTAMRERTEEKLHKQSTRADDLFRVLFHDLANPLGRMSIGLSIAKRALPDMTHRGIEIASQASENMMEITKKIRKMYAISRGKANIELKEVSLKEAFEVVKESMRSDLEMRKINLRFHSDDNRDVYVLVDEASFTSQVLVNIFSNAMRFSQPESTIHVDTYPETKDLIAIEIHDEGIGIPETLKDHLFDLNKKTTRPGTQGETGTGLGLHIVRSFIEAYGGEITVTSKEETSEAPSGTKVKLILPGEMRSR